LPAFNVYRRQLVTKILIKQSIKSRRNGSILAFVVLGIFILTVLSMGILAAAYGVRLRAANIKAQTSAILAAEAAYEEAVSWLNQQPDVFAVLVPPIGKRGGRSWRPSSREVTIKGTVEFEGSKGDYTISFDHFSAAQPVYKIIANGYSRNATRTIEAQLIQTISGWDMGRCEIPVGVSATSPVPFTNEDIIDMPIHINSYKEPDDGDLDIHVSMSQAPTFTQRVSIAESRYKTSGGVLDKYSDIINMFEAGIYFNQPNNKITTPESLETKVERFKNNTNRRFNFSNTTGQKPRTHLPKSADYPYTVYPAVQLEFFLRYHVGYVRITNDCTVCGVPPGHYDYMIDSRNNGQDYRQYDIYGYHYLEVSNQPKIYRITQTYVSVKTNSDTSESGGQIYVDGNVIIGGAVILDSSKNLYLDDTGYPCQLKGKLTVVATGNIWIVSPIEYEGPQEEVYEYGVLVKKLPATNNPNYLGLISLNGVVKVIDPGQSVCDGTGPPSYPGLEYKSVALARPFSSGKPYRRQLPISTFIQSAITVGKGGWGAENAGDRYTITGYDNLVLTGSITEAIRGAVAESGRGYKKYYFFDRRFSEGHIPGDIWLGGKYTPIPGGWKDYRP